MQITNAVQSTLEGEGERWKGLKESERKGKKEKERKTE